MTPQAEQPDDSGTEASNAKTPAKGGWFYPSNQLNLMMNLAKGLFLPPEGFEGKYYRDLLQRYPGWIPLFRTKLPAEVVAETVSEAKYLKPVAVEMDISSLAGKAVVVSVNGTPREISLPEGLEANDTLLLLPAPLPLSLMIELFFQDKSAKDDFLQRVRSSYKNVPRVKPAPRVKKGLFDGRGTAPRLETPLRTPLPLAHTDAAGGIQAMLLHYANRRDLACRYYEWAFREQGQTGGEGFDPILRYIPAWSLSEPVAPDGGEQVRLYWDIVARIVEGPSGVGESFYDLVLQTLQSAMAAMPESKRRQALQGLAEDLQGLRSTSDQTLESLLERHSKPFSRSLILFFVREDCRGLLELGESALDDSDYLAAAILFGAREGWSGLSLELRHGEAFGRLLGVRMAALAQQQVDSGLHLRTPAPWVVPLYRLLAVRGDDPKGEKRRAEERLYIARSMQWDCIYTTISLGKGEYPMEISPAGVKIRFAGEPKAVRVEVDSGRFFQRLANTWLPLEVEEEVRKHLAPA